MSFLDKAKGIAKGVADTALTNAHLVAQAAGDTGRGVSSRVRDTVGDVGEIMGDAIERRKLQRMPETLDYLIENEMARVLLADAIASAEADATSDTTWDEILKAALLDLKSTPVGSAA